MYSEKKSIFTGLINMFQKQMLK